jgi:hypothetical protein
MTKHRIDLGTVALPLMAGDPLRLDVTARTTSGQPGSLGVALADLNGIQGLTYALFNMDGDVPHPTPAFVLQLGQGITVESPAGGLFSVHMTASHTALWTGRDWHAAKVTDVAGQGFSLFDGMVVSTRDIGI